MAKKNGIIEKKKVLLVIESSTSFARDILEGITRYAHERNSWMCYVEPRGLMEPYPLLQTWSGDGVISRCHDRKTYQFIKTLKCPSVELLFNRTHTVCPNEREIIAKALEYFSNLGFVHFGFFYFGGNDWILNRRDSFIAGCQQMGVHGEVFNPVQSHGDNNTQPSWKTPYESELRHWLTNISKPIGVLCANDSQAIYLLNACHDLKIDIPDSIAVLGLNNDIHLCNILSPTLSSIDLDAQSLGYEAARLLERKMTGQECSEYPMEISPRSIITRKSTDTIVLDHPGVVRAIRFIREYATYGISVCDVQKETSLSRKSLQRWFQKILGHSPEREIMLARLRHACDLLLTSAYSIKEIAELSGFSSDQYFIRVFHREKGLTPQQFRVQIHTDDTRL